MRPEAEIPGLLWDALRFARNVRVAVGGTRLEAYLEGGPTAWATERQIELIGEVLSKLRERAPDVVERIPRAHEIIGMRNVLIHGYLVLNAQIVWEAATREVPILIPIIEDLLATYDTDGGS